MQTIPQGRRGPPKKLKTTKPVTRSPWNGVGAECNLKSWLRQSLMCRERTPYSVQQPLHKHGLARQLAEGYGLLHLES